MIVSLCDRATQEQIDQMLEAHGFSVKIAVDIERGIIAGGGELHADCEAVLLLDGSQQRDIWGANWNPLTQEITFESLINIRPRQNNRSIEILDPNIKACITDLVQKLFG